eukprot:1108597-Pelagomonas_calceolata.AAC.1
MGLTTTHWLWHLVLGLQGEVDLTGVHKEVTPWVPVEMHAQAPMEAPRAVIPSLTCKICRSCSGPGGKPDAARTISAHTGTGKSAGDCRGGK